MEGDAPCGFVEFTDSFDRTDVQGSWLPGPNNGDGLTVSSAMAPMPKGRSWQIDAVIVDTGSRFRNYHHFPVKQSGVDATCIELAFSIYVAAIAGTGMAMGSIELDSSTSISLWLEANGTMELVEQTTDGITFTVIGVAALTLGTWHSIRLRHGYGTAERTPLLVVDGTPVAVNAPMLNHGAPTSIYFGAGFTHGDTFAKYWLDELRVH